DSNSIEIRYDPRGNRIYKGIRDSEGDIIKERKYIVDIVGKLPVILCEIDPNNSSLTNKYYYANSQILAQDAAYLTDPNDPNSTDYNRYYYLHDRLGSIRQVVDCNALTVATYTYNPYGEDFVEDCNDVSIYNPFKYTGQWYDAEIAQYYLRARQYDPQMMRFTGRDPVKGDFNSPLTLHAYLYCRNDSLNKLDPTGEAAKNVAGALLVGTAVYSETINMATYAVGSGNYDFLDMAIVMLGVNPAIMYMGFMEGAGLPNTISAVVNDQISGFASDLIGGYKMTEIAALAMSPGAYFMFQWTIGMSRINYGITTDEMNEFNEWNNPSPPPGQYRAGS
ncbi:MAG: RHS repeat-associated core domain-containing protein, partial [Phycisphaerae bacterium]|nr:RHS repeat-associated core domain-containing protein [Phycisphaerae bacterium]